MQAILKPISHPELGEVIIDDALFCVGREGEAFARLPATHTDRLSRRHARLFEQDGVIYIVDLGSRNGTFVNGEPVATQPQRVKSGDVIDFAGALTYRLDVLGKGGREATNQASASTLHLIATVDDGPDSLIVSAFPFLVSKQAEAFAKYQQRAPDELNYLSRRHAHIYSLHGQLLVEDLGSTNGTFVDGQRLGDQAVEIRDGQTIAFGGDFFVYRVALETPDERTRIVAAPPSRKPDEETGDKTTFVTAATSFLDIFCADEAASETPDNPELAADVRHAAGRPRTLLGQLGQALWDREGTWRGRALLIAGLLTALFAAGGYWLLQPSPTDRMQSLLEQQRFDDALTLARSHETAGDGDGGTLMGRLALRALMAKVLPRWLEALDEQRFADARAAVEAERVPNDVLTPARDCLDLLAQIGEIEAAVAERGGLDVPLRWFDDESLRLEHLVDAWRRPQPDKRKVTERMLAAATPAQAEWVERYQTAYRRAASHVRALESTLAVYRPAQQQLTRLLRTHLQQGTLDRLAVELDQLTARYAQFAGADLLRRDLARYRDILEAAQQNRETEAAQLAATASFHAAPFAEAAARLAQEQLPSEQFLKDYAAALDQWKAGQVDAARARLQPLLDTPWKAVAQRQLEEMQRIADGLAEIRGLGKGDARDERLLGFYQALDDDRDRYFLEALRDDYRQSRERAAQRARTAATAAAQAWVEYGRRGGINSTQRLEARVGKTYTERAKALSTAAAEADRAVQVYERAGITIPDQQRQILDAIAQEVALQHQSLDELEGVLDGAALQAKRALLPERRR